MTTLTACCPLSCSIDVHLTQRENKALLENFMLLPRIHLTVAHLNNGALHWHRRTLCLLQAPSPLANGVNQIDHRDHSPSDCIDAFAVFAASPVDSLWLSPCRQSSHTGSTPCSYDCKGHQLAHGELLRTVQSRYKLEMDEIEILCEIAMN